MPFRKKIMPGMGSACCSAPVFKIRTLNKNEHELRCHKCVKLLMTVKKKTGKLKGFLEWIAPPMVPISQINMPNIPITPKIKSRKIKLQSKNLIFKK